MSTYTQDITHLIGKINTSLPDNDTQAITAARIRDAMGAVAYNYDLYVLKTDLDTAGYVSQDDLQSQLADYVTASQLEGLVTDQELQEGMQSVLDDSYAYVVEKISDIPVIDPALYVTQNELSNMGYVTQSQLTQASYINTQYLDQASYVTLQEVSQQGFTTANDFKTINGYSLIGEGDIVISGGGSIDLSAYVTKTELSNAGYITSIPSDYATYDAISQMGYVTESQLQQAGYVTTTSLQSALEPYVSQTQLNESSYVTTSDLNTELGDYPTNNDLALTLQDYVSYSQFNTYTSDFVVDSDLEDLVSKDELSQAGYVTNTSLQSQLQQAGYLTSIPSEYVTESELSSMGYITSSALPTMSDYVSKTELSNAGYLTSIPSDYATYDAISQMGYITLNDIPVVDLSSYVTKTELSNAGYLTSIPSDYITESELSAMGYITSSDIPAIPVIDENLIPNTTATYTLGDSSHLYDATYSRAFYTRTNNLTGFENNNNYTSIYVRVGGNLKLDVNSTDIRPTTNKNYSLGTANQQFSYTYSYKFYENGTDIKDIYTQTEVVTQAEYDALPTADKNGETLYVISDQQPYFDNEIVTEQTLATKGFLTADNFEYDQVTGTLTLIL